MSITIKDMKMPKCCRRCPIPHSLDIVWQYCGALGKSFCNKDSIFDNNPTYKHPDCPIIELHEKHGQLMEQIRKELEPYFEHIEKNRGTSGMWAYWIGWEQGVRKVMNILRDTLESEE